MNFIDFLFFFHAVTSNISNEIEDNQKRSMMQNLLQKIAAQKDQIMKNLELNNCDKAQLDKDIATLQSLQKQYIQFEQLNMGDGETYIQKKVLFEILNNIFLFS